VLSIVHEGEGFSKRIAKKIAHGIAEVECHDGLTKMEDCAKSEGCVGSAASKYRDLKNTR